MKIFASKIPPDVKGKGSFPEGAHGRGIENLLEISTAIHTHIQVILY